MSDAPINLTGPGTGGKAWWAPTMGRMTVKARIATGAIAAALLAVTLVVWNLPSVSSLVTGEEDGPSALEQQLTEENQHLAGQLQSSRARADSLREVLADEQAAREKGEQDAAAAQAEREAAQDAAQETAGDGDEGRSGGSGSSGSSRSNRSAAGGGGSAAGAGAAVAGSGSGGSAPTPGTAGGAANPVAPRPSDPGAPAGSGATPQAPSKAELLDPDSRYFGMYTEQAPFSWATFDAAAEQVGRSQNMVGYFGGWDEDYRANAVTRAWERGMLPMLTWESRPIGAKNDVVEEPDYSLPTIIAGDFDAYLTRYAQDIVATGLPLAIRLDHEMNGVWYPWSEQTASGGSINGNQRGDYVRMWQHVHDIFQAAGANDLVIWVWAPNRIDNLAPSLQSVDTLRGLYPGDDYVDWVGMSGYQRPPYPDDFEPTFTNTFGRTLDRLRQVSDKRILLAEVGASEIGGTKPQWVTSFFEGLDPGANDDVIGFAWFNLAVTTYISGELATNDWRVDSRANSLAAFRAGIADPARRFGGEPLGDAAAAATSAEATAEAAAEPAPTPSPSSTGTEDEAAARDEDVDPTAETSGTAEPGTEPGSDATDQATDPAPTSAPAPSPLPSSPTDPS